MSTEPHCVFLQENLLKDYTTDLMEDLTQSSVSPYDFVPLDLSCLHQGFTNIYFSLLEGTDRRCLGAGILIAAVIYGAWKVIGVWSNSEHQIKSQSLCDSDDYEVKQGLGDDDSRWRVFGDLPVIKTISRHPLDQCTSPISVHELVNKSTGTDELTVMSENMQRQLKDAMTKLEEVRFHMKELENDKELLSAEINVRKQMIHKLQDESSSERERRQQAELKMEMMNMENSQIRQLKKEIAYKTGQVEKLERLVKEKDDVQMKLFQDNIVLPRCIVEARAREFNELQNRVYQLQAQIDSSTSFHEFDIKCQSRILSSSVWMPGDSLSLPAPHLKEVSLAQHKFPTEIAAALQESRSKKVPNTKRKLADRSPAFQRQLVEKAPNNIRPRTSPSLVLPDKTLSDIKYSSSLNDSMSATNMGMSPLSVSSKTNDLSDVPGSLHHKNIGVFAQLRSLISGFRENSSDCNPANLALLKDLGTLLNSRSRPNNSLTPNRENVVSDEQSSVMMSASGGSDYSDTDQNAVPDPSTRKFQNKKGASLKRLSKYRRLRRRDNIGMKRRLAVQYYDGQAHLIGLGETPVQISVSREQSYRSAQKRLHGGSDQNPALCPKENNDMLVSKVCNQNNAHGGDSWILVIPKTT